MKKLLLASLFFLPFATFAAPVSWDFAGGILQPLQSGWAALIKGDHFQATSTTASIFPYASTTATSGTYFCLGADCRSAWPTPGTGTVTQVNTTYPVLGGPITTIGTVSLAFGTTTSNIWAGIQTFTNPIVDGTFTGLIGGNTGTTYAVATSTLTPASPLTGSFTQMTPTGSLGIQVANTSQNGYLTSTDWNTFNNKGSGSVTSIATTWPITGGTITTTGTLGFNGLGTSTAAVVPNLAYFTGVNTFGNVATTSVTCSGTVACTTFTAIGPSPISIVGSSSGGSGTVSTSSSETATRIPFWTTSSATPALLSGGSANLTWDGTKFSTTLASTTALSATYFCLSTDCRTTWPTGTVTSVTGTWPIISSGGATPNITFGGLSTSTAAVVPNLAYFTGVNTFGNVATTSVTCAGTVSCTGFNVIGPSPITITGSAASSGLSTTTPLSGGNLLVYSAGGTGSAFGVATSTLTASSPLTGSFTQVGSGGSLGLGTVGIANGGTATTTGGYTNGVEYFDGSTLTNTSLFRFDGTNLGIGTTTPGSLLSIGNTTGINFTTGTTTFNSAGGINLNAGCFSQLGTCLQTYIQNSTAYKSAANYATNAVLSGTPIYNNGSSGVGATLTEVGTGALSVDGSSPSAGNRVLVKDQVDQTTNGVYTVTATGSGIASYILTRATDFNSSVDIYAGVTVPVLSGTANAGTAWVQTTTGTITLGSSNIVFAEGSAAGGGVASIKQTYGSAQTGAITFATSTTAIASDWGITNTNGTFTFNIPTATASVRGLLSGTDWTTFNGKQAAGNYITTLTGDVTASGPGSAAATLATVNSNVGTFGSATQTGVFTVNGKGLTTAASSVTITPNFANVLGGTAGSVIYSNGTNLAQDNANFFWDATNHRLGIGTTTPSALLEVGSGTGAPQVTLNGGSTSGTGPYMRFNQTGATTAYFGIDGAINGGTGTDIDIYNNGNAGFKVFTNANATPKFVVAGGGNVGIGTTTPYSLFSVGGNAVIGAATAGGTNAHLFINELGTPAGAFLAINPLGQVIATTTPSSGGATSITASSTPIAVTGGTASTTIYTALIPANTLGSNRKSITVTFTMVTGGMAVVNNGNIFIEVGYGTATTSMNIFNTSGSTFGTNPGYLTVVLSAKGATNSQVLSGIADFKETGNPSTGYREGNYPYSSTIAVDSTVDQNLVIIVRNSSASNRFQTDGQAPLVISNNN